MSSGIGAAGIFLTGHGRVLDRRRFELLTGAGTARAVLDAVDGYRNDDGGYGWGLEPWHAIELKFALQVLDALADTRPEAVSAIERLGAVFPAQGVLPVAGGKADEVLRPLDFAPYPDRPVRALFDPSVVDSELERLAEGQESDGGWTVDFRVVLTRRRARMAWIPDGLGRRRPARQQGLAVSRFG